MKMSTTLVLVASILLSAALATGSRAGQSWICSIHDAVACNEDGTVGNPDTGDLEPVTFLRVDADRRQVTLLAPESRNGETTKIDSVDQGEGIWVFSGVEKHRAWSLVLSDAGYMTLSVTGDGTTWSVFGRAMREK